MTISGKDVVKLTEVFVEAPSFALAYGAFANLYENEGFPANQRSNLLCKLIELCSVLYNARKATWNLLNRSEVEGTNSLKSILTCFFCKDLYFHPIVLSCGHSFCRNCVDASFVCHSCSASRAVGELNDCLLLSKFVEYFFPETTTLHRLLDEAKALVNQGKYSEASLVHASLRASHPTNPRCLQATADIYLLTTDFDAALATCNQGLELHPHLLKLHCMKGRTLICLGRYHEALENIFKCLTTCPYIECLRRDITHILEDVITQSDILKWKHAVKLCAANPNSISDVLAGLPAELRAVVPIEPWMHFPPSVTSDKPGPADTPTNVAALLVDDAPPSPSKLDAIRDDFLCALCLRLLFYPSSLPCGHTFCRDCIEQSLDYKAECPLCKASLSQYVSASGRGYCVALWKLLKYLFSEEIATRQQAYERENLALSRVGVDQDLELPVMICCLAFPGIPCPLHISEPQYRSMVRRSINSGSHRFGVFSSGSGPCGLSEIGTVLRIKNCEPLPDGRLLIDTCGCARIRMLSARVADGCVYIRFEFYSDLVVSPNTIEEYRSLCSMVHSMADEWLSQLPCATRASLVPFFGGLPKQNYPSPERCGTNTPAWIWWLVAVLPLNDRCRYKLLACRDPRLRMELLKGILTRLVSGLWRPGLDSSRDLSC
ncbi:hypothetical protein EG68_01510 [Paragonimus skrjabini miyazakii]|uniref:LON peptidase N-terminal domain and RING finger protein 1 n=1 Tax=Paragonimus skrjabini miyazakii TaxID=59628 RepID=A0A8S9Z391_9TREM|nr:hypothetical protein EG68_01510 [Paragonimus skrjabini miyazakii]